ncbi:MAG: YegS/Rv2252/BmrU family lipid kinase [Gemmatimonadales bacterium]
MSGERVCVIVNPAAGRGRGARMIPEIKARFGEEGVTDVRATSAKGDERAIARAAIADGFTTLVVVGGDGTTANVANAIMNAGADTRLAAMPAGTGNDFAKVLGTADADVRTLARLATGPSDTRVDVGRVENVFFLNSCGFGFDVAVLEEIAHTHWLRGSSIYLYAALRQLWSYRGFEVSIRSRGSLVASDFHMLLVIANAAYFGGMFTIAPDASVTDGRLDAVSILDVPAARRIALLGAATRGTHLRYPECQTRRAKSFDVSFAAPPMFETDGELHRAANSSVHVISCPLALRVVAPTLHSSC